MKKYLNNALSEFVYLRTYARWLETESRREHWRETVDRYMNFMHENLAERLNNEEYQKIRQAILHQEVMPSMRLMQLAGPAVKASNVCAYNCSYIAPITLQDFGEIMYVLLCGTGVGFSVEKENIQYLPVIKIQTGEVLPTHIVADTKEGWCESYVLALETWFNGKDIKFDFSKLRPYGARLKTTGGRSSGPEPLHALFDFTRFMILQRQGEQLSTLNVHDLLCKIGEIVVAGGVRRSAMISLSDLDDVAMRNAKQGRFYITDPQRSMANNSAAYLNKPGPDKFLAEWLALMKSGTGERGIFNRGGLIKTLPQRRVDFLTQQGLIAHDVITGQLGTNPCGEIILQSKQFCNLSEVVARNDDDEKSLLQKIKIATILGTFQATLTNFPYLSAQWFKNCEQERLLGVSITGHWDCPAVRQPELLAKLKTHVVAINKLYATRFNIAPSTCTTCVKPSGTVSQIVDCASGMHPRFAKYYIRRVRISAADSLFKMLKQQGAPYHPEVGQSEETATTFVIDFPIKAPEGAICQTDLTAIEQLEYWKKVKLNYTEHNPSATIYIGENEWIAVANWLYQNWDIIGGLSFLPREGGVYELPPFEAIDKAGYEQLLAKFANVDFSQLATFENSDETQIVPEFTCIEC